MSSKRNDVGNSIGYSERVQQTVLLKDYAISNNLEISDETLRAINYLLANKEHEPNEDNQYLLDRCIRDLTEVTYPTTIETVGINGGGFSGSGSRFLWTLAIIGMVILGLTVFSFSALQETSASNLYASILAACLGTLGALIYIFFNLIGVMSEKAFSDSDKYTNSLRLIIGAIIGWVFFFAFVPELASKAKEGNIISLLPFLGGFSTRLVVGILTQAISAVELTLGLEDKSTDLRKRKAKEIKKKSIDSETIKSITNIINKKD